jgi:hypothetical protein
MGILGGADIDWSHIQPFLIPSLAWLCFSVHPFRWRFEVQPTENVRYGKFAYLFVYSIDL